MALTNPRAGKGTRVAPPLWMDDVREHLHKLGETCRSLLDGKLNTNITFTLTANATSTTVTHPSIGKDTVVHYEPTSTTAGVARAAGMSQTYPNATKKQAVINHPDTADTDKTFAATLLG